MRVAKPLSLASKIYVGLAFLYTISLFILPTGHGSQSEFHLNHTEYVWLLVALRIPVVIVWLLIFYAYRCMHAYTESIKDTPEGEHFVSITRGLMYIVWGFLIPGIVVAILKAIAHHNPSFTMFATIFTTYAYALVTLFGFSYISAGAHRVARLSKVQPTTSQIRVIVFGFVCFGVLFCYVIAHRLSSSALDSYNAYYIPSFLVWVTVVIPYLYAWFLGTFAATELVLVARTTPGIIYRRALQQVASGIVMIILAMIFLQYAQSVVPRQGHLTAGVTLGLTYIIYILSAVGSFILATGARHLKRIEEI